MRRLGPPPSAEEIEALARAALERLPEPFAQSLGDVVLIVQDFADEETLAEMGIDDPFDLKCPPEVARERLHHLCELGFDDVVLIVRRHDAAYLEDLRALAVSAR